MSEFLFDIKPEAGHARITIRLAHLMSERGEKVYYTHTSDSVFTSGLLEKGIGRVIYPDDFRWFKPDFALLDIQLQEKARFYEKQSIDHAWITLQEADCQIKTDVATPVICLPPSPYERFSSEPRIGDFIDKLTEIKSKHSRTVIIGLLEEEDDCTAEVEQLYQTIKSVGNRDPQYQFVILANSGEIEEKLFTLPANIAVYRLPNLQALLPLCDMALTAGGLNTWIECTFAHVPMLDFSQEEMKKMTSQKLDRQIKDILDNKKHIVEQQKQLCNLFERENGRLHETADWLINRIKQKRR